MDEIRDGAKDLSEPNITSQVLKNGFQVSKMACSQPDEVAMSPLMKNMLERAGDLKHGERLRYDSPETKAEKWLHKVEEAALLRYNADGKNGYNMSLPLDSKQFYDVDCYDNLKDNQRMIVPGLEEQRKENAIKFSEIPEEIGVRSLLLNDVVFRKAVEIVMDLLPKVAASKEFREVNLPFMTKHSNVGYPYFRNDRRIVPKTNETYAELTMKQSMQTPLSKLHDYNVAALYGRNQGKGRLIIGTSRIINLSLNRLESREIEAYKRKCSLFAGYNDDVYLKRVLTQILEDCKAKGLKCANWDQKGYDLHVAPDLIQLLGAISVLKCNGKLGRDIALERAILMQKTYAVNGMTNQLDEIYGRIFSGFIDTNRGGGIINAIVTLYNVMKQDPSYSEVAYDLAWFMLVMGDDNLFVYSILNHDQYVADMAKLKFEVHPDKQQYGVFFLQYRLFTDPETNQLIMSYPWTRVLRSMVFKETSKGLGPYGWTAAFLQQLSKLAENPTAFKIVLNILMPYDDFKFGYNMSVDQLVAGIAKEDKLAKEKDPSATSTAEKLYDGDPSKARQFRRSPTGEIELDGNFYAEVLAKVKMYYDPRFLFDLGYKPL